MSFVYAGIPIACIINYPLASVLYQTGIDGGWPMTFYVPGKANCSFINVHVVTKIVPFHRSPWSAVEHCFLCPGIFQAPGPSQDIWRRACLPSAARKQQYQQEQRETAIPCHDDFSASACLVGHPYLLLLVLLPDCGQLPSFCRRGLSFWHDNGNGCHLYEIELHAIATFLITDWSSLSISPCWNGNLVFHRQAFWLPSFQAYHGKAGP